MHPALAGSGKVDIALSLCRLHGMSDFTHGGGAASLSHGSWSLTLASTQLTGSDFYWERSYLAAISMQPLERMRIGIAVRYELLQFSGGYRELDRVVLSLGSTIRISEVWQIAVSGDDVNRSRFDHELAAHPLIGTVSVTFQPTQAVKLLLTHRMSESTPDRLSLAERVEVAEPLVLRLGICSNPLDMAAGFSLAFGKFSFDYAYSNNVYLGGTHRLGLRYSD